MFEKCSGHFMKYVNMLYTNQATQSAKLESYTFSTFWCLGLIVKLFLNDDIFTSVRAKTNVTIA